MFYIDQKLTIYSGDDLVGYLLPSDGLKEAKVDSNLNSISELVFTLPFDSPKWSLLEDPDLRIQVDGREFRPLNPIEQETTGSLIGKVTLSESQCMLGRRFPTVGTVPYEVTILASDSGEGGFEAGSAGSAIHRILTAGGTTPTSPTFTRNSTAYNPETGAEVAVNEPRYVAGAFEGSQALLVEDGTTNIWAYSDPTIAQIPVKGNVTDAGGVGDRFSNDIYFGDNSVTRYAYRQDALLPGTLYTLSCYILMDDGEAPVVGTTSNSGDFVLIIEGNYSTNPASVVAVGEGLYRVSASLTTRDPIVLNNCGVLKYSTQSARGFKVSGFQIETGYATTLVPTSGAAATRSPETLTIPTAGVLSSSEGTIECWFYVDSNTQKANRYLFSTATSSSAGAGGWYPNFIGAWITSTNITFRTSDENGNYTSTAYSNASITTGWHYGVFSWEATQLKICLDGQPAGASGAPYLPSTIDTNLSWGSWRAGSLQLNTPIDDLRISNIARSDAEILAAYQSGKPLPVDEHTTYKLTFDGSLTPEKIGLFGWSVGTVDVSGTHDLETEKKSVLENLHEVQKIWGGWLVFDSVNKTVSLRDDTLWQTDTGYEIRYAKNEESLEKITDKTNIVTRLIPLGEKDLSISSVNGGVHYIEDFTYTDQVIEAFWRREDIDDPNELLEAAQDYLAKVSRPRVQYKSNILDLSTLDAYSHESLSLGDIVTLQDEELADSVKVRLIGLSYDVIQPWNCEVILGETITDPQDALATYMSGSRFVQEVIRQSKGMSKFLQGAIDTFTTMIHSANGKVVWSDSDVTFIEIDGGGNETGKRVKINSAGLAISSDSGAHYTTAITGDGILANTIIASDLYALSSDDGYTKMDSSGLHVFDDGATERLHLGHWNDGSDHYGLKVENDKGDIVLDDEGILQTWQDHLVDNVDSTHGLELNLYLPSTTLSIVTARLRLKLKAFRAYESGAEAGGDHRHQVFKYEGDATDSKTKRVFSTVKSDGSFGAYLYMESPGGTDTLLFTKGASGTHVHDLEFGIYEDTTATGVTVTINGTSRTAALGGPFSTDQNDLDISAYLVAGQWNTIVLGSTRLGRIDATVFLQAKMTT